MVMVQKEVVDRHDQHHPEVARQAVDDSCRLRHVLEENKYMIVTHVHEGGDYLVQCVQCIGDWRHMSEHIAVSLA